MSITVYPYKLTQRELEARLEPGLTVLPGQYLRFATPEPIFGQVREVRALPSSSPGLMGGYRLMISLLYGTPSLHPQQAILMNAAQMGHEIQRLQEPIAQPLRLSPDFSAELSRLGPLTLIGGDDFVQKYDALQLLMGAIHPYRRLIILDPLGIFAEEDGLAYWQAGVDVRLSVQAVGSKSFLDTFGELFAPGLRESALRVMADHLPPMHEFMGFQGLVDWYSALNAPLKNLILQNCQMVAKSHVFADTLEQALDWSRTAAQPVTVLNLSVLPEPWRSLFYREAVQSLLEQSGDEVVPVLIYPENYLSNLSQWIQKADELEFKLLMLASPYVSDSLQNMANNRLWMDMPGRLSVMGSLTLGLPLTIPLSNRPDHLAEDVPELSQGATTRSVAPATKTDVRGSGFSSFNIALLDEEQEYPATNKTPPDIEASEVPLHWLGEAAGPLTPPQHVTQNPVASSLEPSDELAVEADLPESHEASQWAELAEQLRPRPIVDLAAPSSESAPDFLSASQLSELLAPSPAAPAEGSLPPIKSVSFSEDDEPVLLPHNERANAPKPDLAGPSSASGPVAPPVVSAGPGTTHAKADRKPTEASQETEIQGLNQVSLSPQPDPMAKASETPVLPPFPTPEEYQKEDFHFDLNPDDLVEPQPKASISQSSALSTSQNTVSQSLNEFASLNLTAQEQSFGLSAADNRAPAATSVNGSGSLYLASPSAENDMQEALDSIFPYQFEAASDEVTPVVAVAHASTATQADEPIEIVQKSAEPSFNDSASFHAGDRVIHPTYGVGVVQKVIPMEESMVLNITFDAVGKRLLDPALCALTREAVR